MRDHRIGLGQARWGGLLLVLWTCWLGLGAPLAQAATPDTLRLLDHRGAAPPDQPVASLSGQELPRSQRQNLGVAAHPVWLQLRLSEHQAERLLHLDNPLLHHVELYRHEAAQPAPWQPVPRQRMVSLSGEEASAWRPIFPAAAAGDYLLKIDSTQALRFALTLQTPKALERDWRGFSLGQGLYLGLVLGLVIYNSVLLLSLRDASYFWYLGFVLGLAGYFVFQKGLLYEFWPSLSLPLNEALMFTSLAVGAASALQFCRRFLLMSREDPRLDRWLQYVGILALAGVFLAWWRPGHTTVVFFSLFGLAVMGLFLLVSVRALRRHFRPARWLLLAWSSLVAGATAFILATYGLLPHHFLTYYGFQVGSAIEAMLLSLALADRISLMHRERETLLDEQTRLQGMSYTDGLTNLHNRRFLDERLGTLVPAAQAEGSPLSLVMLDLDHFKRFNDGWGHLEGDRALQHLAKVMRSVVRSEDSSCRYGGEEFAIVLPGRSQSQAAEVAERIRSELARQPLKLETGEAVHLSCTLGVAQLAPGETAESLLGRADQALYRGKQAGRNRVVAHAGTDPRGLYEPVAEER